MYCQTSLIVTGYLLLVLSKPHHNDWILTSHTIRSTWWLTTHSVYCQINLTVIRYSLHVLSDQPKCDWIFTSYIVRLAGHCPNIYALVMWIGLSDMSACSHCILSDQADIDLISSVSGALILILSERHYSDHTLW